MPNDMASLLPREPCVRLVPPLAPILGMFGSELLIDFPEQFDKRQSALVEHRSAVVMQCTKVRGHEKNSDDHCE
jgi:hypothetical protein